MKLKELFPGRNLPGKTGNVTVKGLTDDSRELKPGYVFFLRPGPDFDVFTVLEEIGKKSVCVVAPRREQPRLRGLSVPVIAVEHIGKAYSDALIRCYPLSEGLKLIGVTGTNGKTTVSTFVYSALKRAQVRAALLGTVAYRLGGRAKSAPFTTPGPKLLRKSLSEALRRGCTHAVMEVSSHGIVQGRIRSLKFHRCVFTNLSRDHLDYHKRMGAYFEAKKKLFTANRSAPAIINADDRYGRKLLQEVPHPISYGIRRAADVRASDIVLTEAGMEFTLHYRQEQKRMCSSLCGLHNTYNLLAGITVLVSLGYSLAQCAPPVNSFKGVEGRMERVAPGIFVDYAHTPGALRCALQALRQMGYRKVMVVFGCGGDRDRGKRPRMGKVADRYADYVILTSDNPRSEDPKDICLQIRAGISRTATLIRLDRRRAIQAGIRRQQRTAHSALLIAGKGHERAQVFGTVTRRFHDAEVVRELRREIA
ncbi:MAG: UDP-N-acetylmuramoyl-L-alanyl-D-glutamate--2,6-diaminopimelate ligase [Candidatus Omnitrophica bacterium]|nr:UDP-N-acetylmuramoyl-L-alanyl-D-glutamate--2,6-diaminopimelate ligase [Candidatus Omnitrophota bacterium]